ncbi:MAG TPA: hypothetical protein VGY54_24030, partial [Polyangiaceae bacterium]|nr:hypothetical protein [Polyangiaceae bacterium]
MPTSEVREPRPTTEASRPHSGHQPHQGSPAILSPAIAMPPFAPAGVSEGRGPRAAASAVWQVHKLASQDWLTVGYLCALLVALAFGKGQDRGSCIRLVLTDLGIYLSVLALVRTEVLKWNGPLCPLLYRLTVVGTLLASFFQLREILPAVSPWADDARIYAFDLRV